MAKLKYWDGAAWVQPTGPRGRTGAAGDAGPPGPTGPIAVPGADSLAVQLGTLPNHGGSQPPADVRKTLYVFKWTGTTDAGAGAYIDLASQGITFTYGYCPICWITKSTTNYDYNCNCLMGYTTLTRICIKCWNIWGSIQANTPVELACFVLGA